MFWFAWRSPFLLQVANLERGKLAFFYHRYDWYNVLLLIEESIKLDVLQKFRLRRRDVRSRLLRQRRFNDNHIKYKVGLFALRYLGCFVKIVALCDLVRN
jgi:hypothetical protein